MLKHRRNIFSYNFSGGRPVVARGRTVVDPPILWSNIAAPVVVLHLQVGVYPFVGILPAPRAGSLLLTVPCGSAVDVCG